MSVTTGLRKLLWDPGALEVAADLIRFFQQSDDPEAFRDALAAGEFDRAFAMLDKSDEEIHEQVTELREQGMTSPSVTPISSKGICPTSFGSKARTRADRPR